MTTVKAWTNMSIGVLKNSLGILEDWHKRGELDFVLCQALVLQGQINSFVIFLERIKIRHDAKQNHHPSQPDPGQPDGELGDDPEVAHGPDRIPDQGPSGL